MSINSSTNWADRLKFRFAQEISAAGKRAVLNCRMSQKTGCGFARSNIVYVLEAELQVGLEMHSRLGNDWLEARDAGDDASGRQGER